MAQILPVENCVSSLSLAVWPGPIHCFKHFVLGVELWGQKTHLEFCNSSEGFVRVLRKFLSAKKMVEEN